MVSALATLRRRTADRIDLQAEATALLDPDRVDAMGPTIVDSAWVGRVPSPGGRGPAFPRVLDAVRRRQGADGAWSTGVPYRSATIVDTLAGALALLAHEPGSDDRAAAERAAAAVRREWARLDEDPEPVIGFELLAPALLGEACRAGLPLGDLYEGARALAEPKLARLPLASMYDPRSTLGFSLEVVGDDLDAERAARLLTSDGSVGASLSATAYYAARTGDPRALRFLDRRVTASRTGLVSYGWPPLWPSMWTLHQLGSAGLGTAVRDAAAPLLERVHRAVRPGVGLAWTDAVPYGDADDTAVGFGLLRRAGFDVDWTTLLAYETDDRFLCHFGEHGGSVSANAHVLQTLVEAAHVVPNATGPIRKALRWLLKQQRSDGSWADKWHASPFYTSSRTAGALVAALGRGRLPDRSALEVEAALASLAGWLRSTRRPDGSWGHFATGTAEETAYAVHAATVLGPRMTLADGERASTARFLRRLASAPAEDHPPLWIAKTLYRPTAVVRSAILAARVQLEGRGPNLDALAEEARR